MEGEELVRERENKNPIGFNLFPVKRLLRLECD
jgi:hypothetical protein